MGLPLPRYRRTTLPLERILYVTPSPSIASDAELKETKAVAEACLIGAPQRAYDSLVAYHVSATPSTAHPNGPAVPKYMPAPLHEAAVEAAPHRPVSGPHRLVSVKPRKTAVARQSATLHLIQNTRTLLVMLAGLSTFGAGLAFATFYTAKPTEKPRTLTYLAWAYAAFILCTMTTLLWQVALVADYHGLDGRVCRSRCGILLALVVGFLSATAGVLFLGLAMTENASRSVRSAGYAGTSAVGLLALAALFRLVPTLLRRAKLAKVSRARKRWRRGGRPVSVGVGDPLTLDLEQALPPDVALRGLPQDKYSPEALQEYFAQHAEI